MAIVLAVLVMFFYSSIMQKYYPQTKKTVSFATKPQTVSSYQSTVSTVSLPEQTVSFQKTISESSISKISTREIDYQLSDMGGFIKAININKHNELGNETLYDINSIRGAIFFTNWFWLKDEDIIEQYNRIILENRAEYTVSLRNGIQITKVYTPKDNYGLSLEIKIANNSDAIFKGTYSIVGVSSIATNTSDDIRFAQGLVSVANKIKRFRPGAVKTQGDIIPGAIDWVAMQNKYFSLVAKPYQPVDLSTIQRVSADSRNPNIYIELQSEAIIEPRSSVTHKFLLYSGPNDPELMALHKAGIEKSVSLGVFGDISRLLLLGLRWFYKVSRNYGVAIILLAFFVSLLLYPLTFLSTKSMRQIQLLQPKIDKLRKEFKDNPQKLNKEIMEMYKKYKVNPFGGCLPMLLQMPIFIALYQALIRAIELKNARFLWIKDLSMPDKAFFLPFSSLIGRNIPVNILPILMAITMFFQQKISAPASKVNDKEDVMQQQQKMMAVLMPVMFGAIFYNMPSGLVLYWFINTLFMLFQQIKMAKSFHVEN